MEVIKYLTKFVVTIWIWTLIFDIVYIASVKKSVGLLYLAIFLSYLLIVRWMPIFPYKNIKEQDVDKDKEEK